jgi:hypothetical protein
MQTRTLLARIERVEQLATLKTKFSPGCVCFPEREPPFFGFSIEEAIAAKVTCAIHGKRTYFRFHRLYLPAWRRENEKIRRSSMSPQYQKAWNASFPPHLWPAEEVMVESDLMLRLKNGALIATGEHISV